MENDLWSNAGFFSTLHKENWHTSKRKKMLFFAHASHIVAVSLVAVQPPSPSSIILVVVHQVIIILGMIVPRNNQSVYHFTLYFRRIRLSDQAYLKYTLPLRHFTRHTTNLSWLCRILVRCVSRYKKWKSLTNLVTVDVWSPIWHKLHNKLSPPHFHIIILSLHKQHITSADTY